MQIIKFILISLISAQAFGSFNNSKEALNAAKVACNTKVDKEIDQAAHEGECDVNLYHTCSESLYDTDRLHKLGYETYTDLKDWFHVSWCKTRKPQSIDPNYGKPFKNDYCPIPKKGKKNKCKDRK